MPAAKAWIRIGGVAALAVAFACAAVAQQTPPKNNASGTFVLGAPSTATTPKPPTVTPAVKRLPDPSPEQIQHIIQVFSQKERLFRQLLQHSYTYTESIVVQEMGPDNEPVGGTFQQSDDVTYDTTGARQVLCTYCPQPQLKDIVITEDDLTDMFNMNMYTISIDELPQYNVAYVDHEPLDQINAYVFSITPKEIVKGHRYFSGRVYVDDKDLMIVKSDGRVVPNQYDKHGNPTNTFLPFQVWRQEVDGKYWFPVYTLMQGVVPGGAPGVPGTPMRMVIQFKNYKRFRVSSRIVSVQALPDANAKPGAKAPTKPGTPTIPH